MYFNVFLQNVENWNITRLQTVKLIVKRKWNSIFKILKGKMQAKDFYAAKATLMYKVYKLLSTLDMVSIFDELLS